MESSVLAYLTAEVIKIPWETVQPSASWVSSSPEWDPRSLPQRAQIHRDRALSPHPHQRESPHTTASPQLPQALGHSGTHPHPGCAEGTPTKARLKPSTPYQPPLGEYSLPAAISAPPWGTPSHVTTDSDTDPQAYTSWGDYVRCMPTKQDFCMLIQEVRETCRSEINMLWTDLHHLSTRVSSLEEDSGDIKHEISHIHSQLTSQASTLWDFHRHLEDLDKRGRRNNIRIRGLPEATQDEDLPVTLQATFNSVLGRPEHQKVKLDWAHRALRPRSLGSRPLDVICT